MAKIPAPPRFCVLTPVPGETFTLAARRRDNGARGNCHAPDVGAGSTRAELITGDYTFSLRPQGATSNYYGYTVTLTVSVTMPQTVDELRDTYRQKLADALAAYTEADYLADDWADIKATYQPALDAINAATDETAMQEAVAGFQAAANLVPTAAERLAAEQERILAELDQAYAAYDKADYTTEGWAELAGGLQQGRGASPPRRASPMRRRRSRPRYPPWRRSPRSLPTPEPSRHDPGDWRPCRHRRAHGARRQRHAGCWCCRTETGITRRDRNASQQIA